MWLPQDTHGSPEYPFQVHPSSYLRLHLHYARCLKCTFVARNTQALFTPLSSLKQSPHGHHRQAPKTGSESYACEILGSYVFGGSLWGAARVRQPLDGQIPLALLTLHILPSSIVRKGQELCPGHRPFLSKTKVVSIIITIL